MNIVAVAAGLLSRSGHEAGARIETSRNSPPCGEVESRSGHVAGVQIETTFTNVNMTEAASRSGQLLGKHVDCLPICADVTGPILTVFRGQNPDQKNCKSGIDTNGAYVTFVS